MGRGPLLVASLLLTALGGCRSAADVATDALAVVDPSLAAATSYVESAGTLLVALTAPPEGESPTQNTLERQRAAMAQRGGPNRFRNEQLVRARENMQWRDPSRRINGFEVRAEQFHNFQLHRLKEALNRGPEREMPVEGSLKMALGLNAALNLGLAPAWNHPVLGELLPLFSDIVVP